MPAITITYLVPKMDVSLSRIAVLGLCPGYKTSRLTAESPTSSYLERPPSLPLRSPLALSSKLEDMPSFSSSKDSDTHSSGGHRGHHEVGGTISVYGQRTSRVSQSSLQHQSTETIVSTRGVTAPQDTSGHYKPYLSKKSTDLDEAHDEDSDEDDFAYIASPPENKGKGRMHGERNENFQIHGPQRSSSDNAREIIGNGGEGGVKRA